MLVSIYFLDYLNKEVSYKELITELETNGMISIRIDKNIAKIEQDSAYKYNITGDVRAKNFINKYEAISTAIHLLLLNISK